MSMTTMFPCPACGYAYTKATNTTRARSDVDTRRKRTCVKCSKGFVTYEITAADYAIMQSMRAWLRTQNKSEIHDEITIGTKPDQNNNSDRVQINVDMQRSAL